MCCVSYSGSCSGQHDTRIPKFNVNMQADYTGFFACFNPRSANQFTVILMFSKHSTDFEIDQ